MCKEIDRIREEIELNISKIAVFQERPLTFLRIHFNYRGAAYRYHAWSKVMRLDEWSPRRGFEVALGKATKAAARKIAADSFGKQFTFVTGSLEEAKAMF